jgi:hypothetical protein
MKKKHVGNFMRGAIRILMRERRAQMLGHGHQPYDENIHTTGTSKVSQKQNRSCQKAIQVNTGERNVAEQTERSGFSARCVNTGFSTKYLNTGHQPHVLPLSRRDRNNASACETGEEQPRALELLATMLTQHVEDANPNVSGVPSRGVS